jgi:hypothetical protein
MQGEDLLVVRDPARIPGGHSKRAMSSGGSVPASTSQ